MKWSLLKIVTLLVTLVLLLAGCVSYGPTSDVPDTSKSDASITQLPTMSDSDTSKTSKKPLVTTTPNRKTNSTTRTDSTTKGTTTQQQEYKPVSSGTWKQERFYLSSCCLPSDYDSLKKFKEAGFNLVEFAMQGDDNVQRGLENCDKLGGIYAVPWNYFRWTLNKGLTFNETFVRNSVLQYDKYKCVIGYTVWDELTPGENNKHHTEAKRMIEYLNKWDPAALKYTLLLPSYGMYTWSKEDIEFSWETGSYYDYVDNYLKDMKPQVLSFDYYPVIMSAMDDTSDWHRDMGLFRKKALEYNIPFWYYYQAEPVNGKGRKPTDAEIRYQMYYGLACGAKELSAWNANGDAMLDEYFEAAKKRNKEMMAVGNYLFDKTTTHYYHTGAAANYRQEFYLDDLSKSDLIKSAPDRVIMSVFTDGKTNTQYLLVVNKNCNAALKSTLELKSSKNISYFDYATEKEVAIGTGTSISVNIPAGNGMIYVLK